MSRLLGADALVELLIDIDLSTVLVQLIVLSELLYVLLELETIRSNVGLDSVALVLAYLALLHQLIQLFFEMTLCLVNLSHLLLHLQEVVLLLLKILLTLFFDFLACLAIEKKFIASNIILLNLFLELLLGRLQLLDVFLAPSDLLIELAQVLRGVLDRMLVFVQGTLSFRDLLSDLVELLFKLPVIITADFHDLGLLSLLLSLELLNLRVQVGKSIMILRHLTPIDFNLGDLLFKLSIVVSQLLLLTLSILEEVLVSRPLNICLIHLTLLRHPAMIDFTV